MLKNALLGGPWKYGLSHTSRRAIIPHSKLFAYTSFCAFPSALLLSPRLHATMASIVDQEHEWSAVRVRNTFLDYFKERGHTFGTDWHSDFM